MKRETRNFESEFRFRTSRSSGAGGQHVNTTETKVELIFDVQRSGLLSEKEKEKIFKKWENRISASGEFTISSSRHRSQASNKEQATKKFYAMLAGALKKEKKRIPTKIPVEVKENILRREKMHSIKKAARKFDAGDLM